MDEDEQPNNFSNKPVQQHRFIRPLTTALTTVEIATPALPTVETSKTALPLVELTIEALPTGVTSTTASNTVVTSTTPLPIVKIPFPALTTTTTALPAVVALPTATVIFPSNRTSIFPINDMDSLKQFLLSHSAQHLKSKSATRHRPAPPAEMTSSIIAAGLSALESSKVSVKGSSLSANSSPYLSSSAAVQSSTFLSADVSTSDDAHLEPLLPSEETTAYPLVLSDISTAASTWTSSKSYHSSLPFSGSMESSAESEQKEHTLLGKVHLSAEEATLAPLLLVEEPANNTTTWAANQTQPEPSLAKLLVQEAIKQNCKTSKTTLFQFFIRIF
jgi:hypothetical protein